MAAICLGLNELITVTEANIYQEKETFISFHNSCPPA